MRPRLPDGLAWLTARPVAHRGLHDAARGIIENTESAVRAAIAADYAIEVDIQRTADDDAVVHHDDTLGRLTDGAGALAERTVAELKRVPFKATGDRMLALGDLCDLVAGRVPLVIEVKSRFDGDLRLVERAASVLTAYPGPAALMSFDPAPIAALRTRAPALPRGIVAERTYAHREWAGLTAAQRRALACFLHWPRTRPHFVAYAVRDFPAWPPLAVRWILRRPLLTWTVRTEEDRHRAARFADQMIFEGFRP